MKHFIIILFLFTTIRLHSETPEKATPFSLFIDIGENEYKDKYSLSGFGIRFKSIGIGYSEIFGIEPLEVFSRKESSYSSMYTLTNLESFFVFANIYIDIKKLYASVVPMFGYGPIRVYQDVWAGENGIVRVLEPRKDNRVVLGMGIQFYPAGLLVLGLKYDTVNKFAIQLGIGLSYDNEGRIRTIGHYFKN